MKQKDTYGEITTKAQLEAGETVKAMLVKDEDLLHWKATLAGGVEGEGPYSGGIFSVKIDVPIDYPFKAPKVKFETPIYHPGIDAQGNICLKELTSSWQPQMTLLQLIEEIRNKLNDPSPEDPFVPDIARELKDDRPKFESTAREWTKKHASPKS